VFSNKDFQTLQRYHPLQNPRTVKSMSSTIVTTKRRLEDATQPLKKKQKVADGVDLKIDATLQSIESLYESLYDDEGTISTTNQSRIATFQDRMTTVVKYNEVKKTELAYRQTVGEQIKRLCESVDEDEDSRSEYESESDPAELAYRRAVGEQIKRPSERSDCSDFATTIVKGLRFVNVDSEETFNADWNQGQYISTYTADIALKRRAPSTIYIRMMRELLNEHTSTDTISDIISGFCSKSVVWYRINAYSSSTDTYREFNSSGFQQLESDEDDLFRGPMFYKPRDEYTIRRGGLTVQELRRDLDESAMSKLTDIELKKFFADVCEALFNEEWEKTEEWILEGTCYER